MIQVLTGGKPPFYWLNTEIVKALRVTPPTATVKPVGVPVELKGLFGISTLEAAGEWYSAVLCGYKDDHIAFADVAYVDRTEP